MTTDERGPVDPSAAGEPSATTYCGLCGQAGDGPPGTWMMDTDPRRGQVHYCPTCARTHLRAIESKLQQEWW